MVVHPNELDGLPSSMDLINNHPMRALKQFFHLLCHPLDPRFISVFHKGSRYEKVDTTQRRQIASVLYTMDNSSNISEFCLPA